MVPEGAYEDHRSLRKGLMRFKVAVGHSTLYKPQTVSIPLSMLFSVWESLIAAFESFYSKPQNPKPGLGGFTLMLGFRN